MATPKDTVIRQWIHTPQSRIRDCLEQYQALLLPKKQMTYYAGDDSLPDKLSVDRTDFLQAWRCQNIPRIHLLLEGEHSISFIQDTKVSSAQLCPGDIWYLPADAHDHEEFTTPCRYAAVIFHPAFTRFLIVNFHSTRKKGDLICRTWTYHWKTERPPALNRTVETLSQLLSSQDEKKPDLNYGTGYHLSRAIWSLIYTWLKEKTEDPPLVGKAHASWLIIDRFLQENYHRPINRKEAALAVGLHPSRISALCSEFTGMSFNDILQERRLRQAKRYLDNSSHKIETISALCGYGSAAYFSRVFREKTGVTPGQWRLNQRAE